MDTFDASLIELGDGEIALLASPQEESVNTSSKSALGMNEGNKTKMQSTATLNTGPILALKNHHT